MTEKVIVPYEHDDRDTRRIWLAVTSNPTPSANEWRAAWRDIIDGRRVVWARFPSPEGTVWIRDRRGERKAHTNKPATATAMAAQDPAAKWSATLLQPTSARHDTPDQPIVVLVKGPGRLDGPVHIGAETTRAKRQVQWTAAAWDGDPGRRLAVGRLGPGGLNLDRGRYTVIVAAVGVRVNAGRLTIT